jgi:hypothetical protein
MQLVDAFDQLANLAQICQKAPTISLRRAYVNAMRDWCQQSRWLRETVVGATAADVRLYSLGSDPYLDIVGVVAMQGSQSVTTGTQYWSIVQSDPTLWNPNSSSSQPMRYAYIPEGQFAVDPLPRRACDLAVTVVAQPREGAVRIPEAPIAKYGSVFEAGALAYLLNIPGQKWSSPVLAQAYAREFRSGIANAKAEVQRGFNGGSLRARTRAFVR